MHLSTFSFTLTLFVLYLFMHKFSRNWFVHFFEVYTHFFFYWDYLSPKTQTPQKPQFSIFFFFLRKTACLSCIWLTNIYRNHTNPIQIYSGTRKTTDPIIIIKNNKIKKMYLIVCKMSKLAIMLLQIFPQTWTRLNILVKYNLL